MVSAIAQWLVFIATENTNQQGGTAVALFESNLSLLKDIRNLLKEIRDLLHERNHSS